MASEPSWGSTIGSQRVFKTPSCRYGARTASQSRSASAGGRSRLHNKVNVSPSRFITIALASSSATVIMPTRCGLQHAVTSIAKRDTWRLYPLQIEDALLRHGDPKGRGRLRSRSGDAPSKQPSLLSEGPSPVGGGPSLLNRGGDRCPPPRTLPSPRPRGEAAGRRRAG